MLNFGILVGSTRPTRSADLLLPWVARRAGQHGGFDVGGIHLRDWPLRMFAEHPGTIGDFRDRPGRVLWVAGLPVLGNAPYALPGNPLLVKANPCRTGRAFVGSLPRG